MPETVSVAAVFAAQPVPVFAFVASVVALGSAEESAPVPELGMTVARFAVAE